MSRGWAFAAETEWQELARAVERWRDRYARVAGKAYDIQALQLLRPYLPAGYLPWSKSALRPGVIACIVNEIVLQDRRVVVEFGAGISTLVVGRCLRERGGRLYSFEHDAAWAARVRAWLAEAGIGEETVRVVHAPLSPGTHSLDGVPWYGEPEVAGALGDARVDLVVCDGPPAYREDIRFSRYPALPFLLDRLNEDCAVILDDVDRDGEREIARRWAGLLGARFSLQLLRGSFALGIRGRAFDTLI